MITPIMKKFLEKLGEHPKKTIMYCVYIKRIHKRIDHELEGLLWLSKNYRWLFLEDYRGKTDPYEDPYQVGRTKKDQEINRLTGKTVSNERLRKLMVCLKHLHQKTDITPELVLEVEKDGV